jgi:hypothetical protein
MKKAAITILVVLLISALLGCASSRLKWYLLFGSKGEITDEMEVNGITVRTYWSDKRMGTFEILRGEKILFEEICYGCYIGGKADNEDEEMRKPLPGADITGDGKPNLVVYVWTGGAHCCYIAYLFELGTQVKLIAEIDGRHGTPSFADLDGDSIPEVVVRDWTFEYWPASFASSPAPNVILRWKNGDYVPDAELMKIPEPSPEELSNKAESVRNNEEWDRCKEGPDRYSRDCIPEELFQTALDLMYGGHEELGRQFIGMAWKSEFPMDTELLAEFDELLSESPFWQAMQGKKTGTPQGDYENVAFSVKSPF